MDESTEEALMRAAAQIEDLQLENAELREPKRCADCDVLGGCPEYCWCDVPNLKDAEQMGYGLTKEDADKISASFEGQPMIDSQDSNNEDREVARVQDFWSGKTPCIRCGKTLHLYFNGGELDARDCCGLTYKTELQRVDLVVYERGV